MNQTCYITGCGRKAIFFCECSNPPVLLCVSHLTVHTVTPGKHNPKEKIPESNVMATEYVKCSSKYCTGVGVFYCNCNQESICLACLHRHLLDNSQFTHSIEVKCSFKPNYEDTVHPLDVFLRRAQCDSELINKVKMKNISIREILDWDMRKLNSMTDYLGLSSTMKYLLWEEINYIKIVTERTYLRNEYMARLVFGIEDPDLIELE